MTARRLVLVFVASPLLAYGYARWVEPRWLEVTHHAVALPVTAALRVGLVTDLHTTFYGSVEQDVVAALRAARPDVILMTGDAVHASGRIEPVTQFLSELAAPLGVWFVPGNWEYWVLGAEPAGFLPPNVRPLVNAAVPLRADVWLVGVDDALAGAPDVARAFRDVSPTVATIAIFHSPAVFPELSARSALALAGHTHGGQVRLPFVGALWLPPASGNYEMGWYTHGSSRMYVSRGIGMSIMPIRFLCRPELAIIEVQPERR